MNATRTKVVALAMTAMCAAIPAAAIAGGKGDEHDKLGRFTGGGNTVGLNGAGSTVKVTHGLSLRCRTDDRPQRLEVNWSGGGKFHLEDLIYSSCRDGAGFSEGNPKAGFDTYVGHGFGRDGTYAEWKFTDHGEPGREDTIEITVWDADDNKILVVDDDLSRGGNHQAHRATGSAAK